jgi:cobalt-zinc-cadmium efflux system outer membrane protein
MRRFKSWFALGAVALAGCQATTVATRVTQPPRRPVEVEAPPAGLEAQKMAIAKADASLRVPVPKKSGSTSAGSIRLVGADDEDLESAAPPPVPGNATFGLDDAIERGLVWNPDMIAVRQAEGVSAAAYGVAETYPFNPFIQVRVTPYQQGTEPNINQTFHYILLMQTVQLAHQQQFREEIAASQLNQVRWNIHNFELLNAAQTTRLYFTAIYQKGLRDLTRSNAELNEELLRISERRLDAGDITPADLAIVRIDTRSTRQQANLAEANYQTALLDLRRQLNLPLEAPIELKDDLISLRWKPLHEAARSHLGTACPEMALQIGEQGSPAGDRELIKRLADGRPDVMAAHADVDTAHASYRLANAARVPDLQIGPFYQVDEFGTTFFGFQAQMDIPVNNTGKPLARQRAAEHGQRTVTWQQLQARAEIEAVAAVDRYERARRLVDAALVNFQDDLPVELKRLEQQFKENEVDVLRIFQGRQSLIQNRRAVLDMLNELAQATAGVTATTGVFPRDLVTKAP